MSRLIPVANAAEIPEGTGREFAVEGRIVAVYNVGGAYYALDGICPHAGGPLGEGELDGCVVTCPWHGWQFDVTTGRHCLNPRLQQGTYAVRREGDDLLVELP
jgi:nitrite reductase/ring-hydroxylating ferredoxin subunit